MKSKGTLLRLSFVLALVPLLSSCATGSRVIQSSSLADTGSPPPSTTTAYLPLTIPREAPLDVSLHSDGQLVRVNLVRLTLPSLSSSNTSVVLNGSPATANGSTPYVYLDLKKGPNVIEVDTPSSSGTQRDYIHLTFQPPLAVYLGSPAFGPDVLKGLTPIYGQVSDPAADVEVNGEKVDVKPYGRGRHVNSNCRAWSGLLSCQSIGLSPAYLS